MIRRLADDEALVRVPRVNDRIQIRANLLMAFPPRTEPGHPSEGR